MIVQFTRDCTGHIQGSYVVEEFRKGQQFDGLFAEQLLALGMPVEVIDRDGSGVDENGDGVPEGSTKQVMDWVLAGDAEERLDRARMALDVEQSRGDHARKGLVADLTKLIG